MGKDEEKGEKKIMNANHISTGLGIYMLGCSVLSILPSRHRMLAMHSTRLKVTSANGKAVA